jgi:hypothetical protein
VTGAATSSSVASAAQRETHAGDEAGSELLMATDGDIERMFKDVGLSQWPMCAFYVEHKRSNPLQAASVYIIPKGDMGTSID